jgi:isocitrate dehydrogenase
MTRLDDASAAMDAAPTEIPIVVARGDGIGPEIMDATLRILAAAQAPLAPREIAIGESVYLKGVSSGIENESLDLLREVKTFLKAPITTPRGGGYKSLNVTTRKLLGLYANVRPCRAYHPYVSSRHPDMDLIVVRENEEDTYAGIEHRQTAEVTQCLKLISRPGCEKIARYAFDLAVRAGRKRVTCMVKDNIMKITDGLFRQVFEETAARYPEIEADSMIIDIGTARIADDPSQFDVVLLPNLYGDIVSDVTAQIAGSVGLAGSANIGDSVAMFEAIHGSAPDISGKGIANPSGLLQAAVMMLAHLDLTEHATLIENAWLRTIEDGVTTGDVRSEASAHTVVGTQAFADAVIERLGEAPKTLRPARYQHGPAESAAGARADAAAPAPTAHAPVKRLAGVDVFMDWHEEGRDSDRLAAQLLPLTPAGLKLKMITNRGVRVWPDGLPETFRTDHWRCRFVAEGDQATVDLPHATVVELLGAIAGAGLDFIKTEHLCTFDGEPGWSAGQGQ